MKRIALLLLAGSAALAQQPAAPVKKPALLTSDLNGRDMLFIAQAVDHEKTLTFLAIRASQVPNPELRGFATRLAKSIAVQSAVLNSLAEMRHVRVPDGDSISQNKYRDRFEKLDGQRLHKAILEAFLETSERAVMTYELAEKSGDSTIREFVSQTLPPMREHLLFLQSLAGVSPNRSVALPATEKKPAPATPGVPGFRINVAK